jgi:hypothetical protein
MPKGSGRTKNLRYGADESNIYNQTNKKGLIKHMDDLFGNPDDSDDLVIPAGIGIDDLEDIYEIDIDNIGKNADIDATSNVQNLLRLYNNKEFTDEHPDFKRRIDTEVDSLRMLYKMARINEVVHDHLITAISKNPGNASLYMALDRIQGKVLAVDKQIREQISSFNKIITGYQMELNFAQDNGLTENTGTSKMDDGSVLSRGSKAFIEQMKSTDESTDESQYIDRDDIPDGWKVDEDTGDIYDEDTGEVMGKVLI